MIVVSVVLAVTIILMDFLLTYIISLLISILITLERLNQSEPNFHTGLLTGIARPRSKWASQVTCSLLNIGLLPPENSDTSDFDKV